MTGWQMGAKVLGYARARTPSQTVRNSKVWAFANFCRNFRLCLAAMLTPFARLPDHLFEGDDQRKRCIEVLFQRLRPKRLPTAMRNRVPDSIAGRYTFAYLTIRLEVRLERVAPVSIESVKKLTDLLTIVVHSPLKISAKERRNLRCRAWPDAFRQQDFDTPLKVPTNENASESAQ